MLRVLLICSALALAGCVTTSMQGYADRDIPTKGLRHIAAYVAAPSPLAASMQTSIREEARKHAMLAEDVLTIVPPTRQYSDAEVRRLLLERDVDGVLIIKVADSGIVPQYAGTFFQSTYNGTVSMDGTATRLGNMSTVSLSGTHSGTSFGSATPTYRYSRRTLFSARLIDPKTGRNFWVGEGEVDAGGGKGFIGRLLVADGVSSSNSISAIFSDLEKNGILRTADAS